MKKLKFIIIAAVVLLTTGTVLYFMNRESPEEASTTIKSPEDINRIEIQSEYGYPHETYEYIIDFTDNTIKTHSIDCFNEEKEKFVRKANAYGFFDWEELYECKNVEDGLYETYYIIYNDGSQHETTCANDYPPTYEGMQIAFCELF